MTTQTMSFSIDRVKDYAEEVVSGDIVAGPHVRNSCQRHLLDLENAHERGLYFDLDEANKKMAFFENILKLSEGQFEGQPFQLHPSQAFIVGSIYGWKRQDGTRRFRRCYIEQGKGNGKSPMAGGIGLNGLCADGEAGAQIYSAAAKREQAGILFADAVKMVKASPSLRKRLEFSGGEGREYNIAFHKKQSFFRPVSRDTGKTGSGPRPYFVLVDEVHELPDATIIETLENGFKFRRSPLLFMITNSGSDRNSVAWHEHEHAIKVASGNRDAVTDPTFIGEVIDDNTFSYVCALDKDDDPLNDSSCWVKANPLLGVTITEQYLKDKVQFAKAIPSRANNILRLHFCVWTDAESAWMTRDLVEPCIAEFDETEHYGKPIYKGLDLSSTRDLTVDASVVKTGETDKGKPIFDAWVKCYTPKDTLRERAESDKMPSYLQWVEDGYLEATNGKNVDYLHVAQSLSDDAHNYDIQMVAYDRYAFGRFEDECNKIDLDVEFVEHPQGGIKKGKPTEGMKEAAKQDNREPQGLWMPGSVKEFEDAVLEGRVRMKNNPLLISAIMSAVLEQDKWDNKWLAKRKSLNRIDPIVALCMAFGAANSMHVKTSQKITQGFVAL